MNNALENARAALAAIPSNLPREEWHAVGRGALAAGLSLADLDDWSSSADNYVNRRDVEAAFRGIDPDGGTGAGTLFFYAKQYGYQFDSDFQPYTPTAADIAQRAAKREADARELARKREAAAVRAASIWNAAEGISEHAYLSRKHIQAHGAKRFVGVLTIGGMDCNGALLLAMRLNGKISSLQFIQTSGEKRFLPDGEKGGWLIGKIVKGVPISICEGFATGASIHEATGYAVVVAFDAGNLRKIAEAVRAKHPDAVLVLCADDDVSGTGQRKAQDAAQAVGGLLALPVFGADRTDSMKDFNDMANVDGLAAVKRVIEGAGVVAQEREAIGGDVSGLNAAEHADASIIAPEPLPDLPSVLPFDFDYLPTALRTYVQDISERMQCPPDFAAVGVLVMIAAIIGRKVAIRPMREDDWTVIPNLWGAVVGNSGVMKSPTLSAAMSPIKKLAAAATDEFNAAQGEYAALAEVAKLKQSVNKTTARATLKKNQTADVKKLLQVDGLEGEPVLKRYMTNNASYEALGELLIENPNGLLVESDEIIGLLKQLDASGQEVARSFYLTAADGDKPYTFDRIIRGKGLRIEAVCLSLIGGIQPGVLAEYVRQAVSGGAGADGLLQRFGLMVYPDISPEWEEVDRFPDSAARQTVQALVERLDSLHVADIGAEVDQFGGVPFLRFDDKAQVLFSEWRAGLEARLRSGEEHPAMVSHLSKYRKLIPTLALINHLCDSRQGAVSEQALLRAITLSEYLESHAQRIYSYATRPDIDAAKTLLKRLASGKLSNPFKARDLSQKGWAGLETPIKAQAAIELLQEYRHLNKQEVMTSGRPTALYHWASV